MSDAPRPQSAPELAARLRAEREGRPFLLFRDGDGTQQIVALAGQDDRLTIGRDPSNDVALTWDGEVSRVHAELLTVGSEWVVADQGISRNGTFVNGSQIRERHRLGDGDVLRLGQTLIAVALPDGAGEGAETTLRSPTVAVAEELTTIQRRILAELCRPLISASPGTLPSSNQEIAEAVHLSVQGVKSQLRNLSDRFGYGDLPQNRKRLALAERAVRLGLGRGPARD